MRVRGGEGVDGGFEPQLNPSGVCGGWLFAWIRIRFCARTTTEIWLFWVVLVGGATVLPCAQRSSDFHVTITVSSSVHGWFGVVYICVDHIVNLPLKQIFEAHTCATNTSYYALVCYALRRIGLTVVTCCVLCVCCTWSSQVRGVD